jgi:tRNA G18 (ribose-2'-O)-methylase SpoU
MIARPGTPQADPAGQQLDGQALYERQKSMRSEQPAPPGPAIVAAGLTVPENMGSVLRLADAAGCHKVLFVGGKDSPAVRARLRRTARSCDSFVHWDFCSLESCLGGSESLQPLIAIELTAESSTLFDTRLADPCTFVVGSERHGVPAALLARCQSAVHIPMYGVNGSMNVTHALAIALFEWRRQWA